MAKLIISEDGREKIFEIIDDVFTIGSGEEADLRVRDELASEKHVEIRKTPKGFKVIDLETRNGTSINGRAVNQHMLGNGDTLEIGEVRITYIGAGPKRSAGSASGRGGRQKKTNLQSSTRSHYRREGWSSKISGLGMFGIAIAGIAIIGLLAWVFTSATKIETPKNFIAMENAWDDLEKQPSEQTVEKAEKVLAEMGQHRRQFDDRELASFRKLRAKIDTVKKTDIARIVESRAQDAYVRIKNHDKFNPNDYEGRIKMAEAFLAKYEEGTPKRDIVENYLKRDREKLKSVPPEQKELAALEKQVHTLVWGVKMRSNRDTGEVVTWKNFRAGYELLGKASPSVKAVFAEEIEAMRMKIKKRSRAVLGIRKNEVRHALRENDRAKADRMIDAMLENLVPQTIKDYLSHPDGGYEPPTQKLELETQALLKAAIERAGL